MALKPLNSVGGFSVGEIPANVILSNADIISNNLTVQKVANLGPVGNVIITGGSANQYLQTDGFGNLTWTTADTSRILNGTSNVSIPTANGNVNTSVGGVANVLVVTTTGANVTGTFESSGNLTALNANLGNLVTANYANFANDLVVQGNIANANNISVTNNVNAVVGNFSGNINSLNANLGNLAQANYVNVSQQINGNTANFSGNVEAGGVKTDNLYHANGQPWDFQQPAGSNTEIQYNDGVGGFGASSALTFNYSANVLTVTGNANVSQTLNGNVANFSGNLSSQNANLGNLAEANYVNVSQQINGNVANFSGNLTSQNANLGNLATANFVNVSSNINVTDTANVGNLRTDNLLYANGQPWDLQEAAGANTEIQYNMGDNFAASANFTYNDTTQVFTVAGNANVTNTVNTANINSGTSNLTLTANGLNTILYANGDANFPGNVYAHTFFGNVNANITITAANTSVLYSDNGLISGASGFTFDKTSNLFSTPGNLDVADYLNVVSNANINGMIISQTTLLGDGNGIQLKDDTNGAQLNYNNINYVYVDSTGAALQANGFFANLTTDGNFSLPNNLSVVGDIANANNINVTNALSANTGNFSGNISSLNANLGNLAEANYVNVANNLTTLDANVTGTLTVANANISSNLTVNNLTVNLELAGNTANFTGNVVLSGPNVTVNNYLSGNIANFSGNITSLNANLGNIADANFVRSSELYNGNSNVRIAPNGNVTVSATGVGDVLTVSNVGANIVGYVHANGNGTFGALYSNTLTAQGGNLTIYAATGDNYVELRPTGNGHVDVGNTRIQSLANPINAQDAATKFYVDTVAEGLHVHPSCGAATPDTLANISSGTVTYNNGTDGVGATLTTTGTYTLIDGVNVASSGFRILVKDEANLAHNGIYTYTNSTTLTRATDFDTAAEIAGGDFTFVTGGTLYNSTGWVQIDEVTTVGTDPIVWDQFSGAGEYTAGSGLTLTGTVFSVNVDNLTTEIAGGNVVVKANAQFTTPNIGAATGTSLDLTGNLQANNVNSNNLVTTTDLQASGNILSNNISANANLLVNNATINVALTGNTANFSGNVAVPNLTVNTALTGNTANFSGNIVVNNATVNLELAGNTANFSGNIVAGNISTAGSGGNITGANVVSANTFSGNLLSANFANVSSNTITNNLSVNLELGGNTANFSGNVVLNNLLANGVANVGNLHVQANVTSALNPNANLTFDLGTSTQRWANVYAGNVDVSGNITTSGNLSANNFSANTFFANTSVDIGNTAIYAGQVTTTSITANQTISTLSVTGVTGVEWLVKGYDSSGAKYSMAMVTAVTDGANADFSTFGTVNLGSTTGSLAVNIVGSNIELQVTPATSNSTVWVTQYRTI